MNTLDYNSYAEFGAILNFIINQIASGYWQY